MSFLSSISSLLEAYNIALCKRLNCILGFKWKLKLLGLRWCPLDSQFAVSIWLLILIIQHNFDILGKLKSGPLRRLLTLDWALAGWLDLQLLRQLRVLVVNILADVLNHQFELIIFLSLLSQASSKTFNTLHQCLQLWCTALDALLLAQALSLDCSKFVQDFIVILLDLLDALTDLTNGLINLLYVGVNITDAAFHWCDFLLNAGQWLIELSDSLLNLIDGSLSLSQTYLHSLSSLFRIPWYISSMSHTTRWALCVVPFPRGFAYLPI